MLIICTRRVCAVLACMVAVVMAGCQQQPGVPAAQSPDGPIETVEMSADGKVAHVASTFRSVIDRKDDRLVVVDFWAEWCGPCKALAPELETVKEDWGDRVVIVKVNVDDNPEIARHFQVEAIPDVRFLRNGEPIGGFVGFTSAETISSRLKNLE